MGVTEILTQIDREIALLQKARALLVSESTKRSSARPAPRTSKRVLTPEGRKRIAEAVKRRWEQHRKAAKKAVPSK